MRSLLTVFSLTFFVFMQHAQAQNDGSPATHFNTGIGASGWGIPIYASYDVNVAEDINVGGRLSFQSTKEGFSSFGGRNEWRHTIVGINGVGYYYFNRILDIPEQFDVYGGASLGFYIWNTKSIRTDLGPNISSSSASGSGGLGIGILAGGRYYFKENLGVNLELGGGNVLSGLRLGVSWKL